MSLLRLLFSEIAFYWPWFLCFAVIALCSTRYLGWFGLFVAALLISSVFHDMRENPEGRRDADFVFWFGLLFRIGLYNIIFMPIGVIGLKIRARRARVAHETKPV